MNISASLRNSEYGFNSTFGNSLEQYKLIILFVLHKELFLF